jgi:hypothetical protein
MAGVALDQHYNVDCLASGEADRCARPFGALVIHCLGVFISFCGACLLSPTRAYHLDFTRFVPFEEYNAMANSLLVYPFGIVSLGRYQPGELVSSPSAGSDFFVPI